MKGRQDHDKIVAPTINRANNMLSLPCEILDKIVEAAAETADEDARILNALAATCRTLGQVVDGNKRAWKVAWSAFSSSERGKKVISREEGLGKFPIRDRLRLLSMCGCMTCGKARIRKVYWQFRRRLCEDCLHANTVSESKLMDCGIDSQQFQGRLPSNTGNLWTNFRGSYEVTFYWIEDVQTWCKEEGKRGLEATEEGRALIQEKAHQAMMCAQQMRTKELKTQAWRDKPKTEKVADRCEELEKSCLAADEKLTRERLQLSETYLKNIKLSRKLTNAAKLKLIPKILEETGVQAENEMLRRESEMLRQESEMLRRKEKELRRQRNVAGGSGKCEICVAKGKNVNRVFTAIGLRDHTKAVH